MSRYIATYDIAGDPQRAAAASVLLKYGERLQKSVFEVWLEPEDLPLLRCDLGALLDRQDAFELIPIDQSPNRSRWRWGEPLDEFSPVVVLGR